MLRNGPLLRVVASYALFSIAEYVMWIAVLVFAYDRGGATTAGLVVVLQLVPAAALAPVFAPLADRRSPVGVLAGGYALQATMAATTAALLFTEAPAGLVYLSAVVFSTAVSTSRPAQAALLPAVTREPRELTAANGVIGWVDRVSIMLAGGAVATILTFGTVAHVSALAAVLMTVAVLLVVPLHSRTSRRTPARAEPGDADPGRGFRDTLREPHVRLLVTLLGAEYVVIGALDVLLVVLALDILAAGEAWVGYLNMAYGAGGVLLGALAFLLVGRRLGPVVAAMAGVLGASLALTAATHSPAVVVVLLALAGGTRGLFDVGLRALLQRSVPADQIARAFGVAEALSMAGVAVGAVFVPVLVSLGGGALALLGAAAILPAIVVLRLGRLLTVDRHAEVPVVEIALLTSLPIFRGLPLPALEGLARAMEPVRVTAGSDLVRQGEPGDCYYALASGEVNILRKGRVVNTLHRGEGLGEMALLGAGLRTASAVAVTPVLAFRLDRSSFLIAVTGHAPTFSSVSALVRDTEDRDARRDSTGSG